uniref:Uncharacterized protein n=1 Tax=Hydrodictyon reticulatum TaxID=3107 RepID=A0A1W6F7M7_HYDRE|nr:hypothetical protein [Hydrodictyon reticulatum]ARK36690.1 hypothetical protein [Hydrodictyon reticulatum]
MPSLFGGADAFAFRRSRTASSLWLRRSRCLRFSAKLNRFFALASAEPMPSLFSEAEPLLRFGFGGADAFAFRRTRTASSLRRSLRFSARFGEASAPLRFDLAEAKEKIMQSE